MNTALRRGALWAERDAGAGTYSFSWPRALLLAAIIEIGLVVGLSRIDWSPPASPRHDKVIRVAILPPPPIVKKPPPSPPAPAPAKAPVVRKLADNPPPKPPISTPAPTPAPLAVATPAAPTATAVAPTPPAPQPQVVAVSPSTNNAGRIRREGEVSCTKIKPEMPTRAIEDDIASGRVRFLATVGADGHVKTVEVLLAEPPGYFEQAVMRSVKRWICEQNGGDYKFQGEVSFRLDG
ncbi:MAG: energy transducer TonB [Rhodocyclales bacterium]|nr:energy transducer TonB [Rhodocyclales bacterium]